MSARSVANDFWNAMARSVPAQFTTIKRWSDLLGNYGDDRMDEARAAIVADLANSGVQTDLPNLMAAYADCIRNSVSFWAGSYLLRSAADELFSLSISSDWLQLSSVTRGVTLLGTEHGFQIADQTLTFSNAAISMRLELGIHDPTEANDPGQIFDNHDRIFRVVNSGEIVLREGALPTTIVGGKEGVFTLDGLASSTCGDPLQSWVGRYDCGFTDGVDDLGTVEIIAAEPGGSLQLSLNGRLVSGALLRNNALAVQVPRIGVICAQFIADAGGARVLEGVLEAPDGSLRTFRGGAQASGSAQSLRGDIVAARSAGPWIAPKVCDIANDQIADLGDPSTFVVPVLSALPVVYDDGSQGTIEITPVRAADVYRVPPGQLSVVQRADGVLAVGWLLDKPIQLLDMVQPDAYDLRFTLKDWHSFDNAGLDIGLHRDPLDRRKVIAVDRPAVRRCDPGSLGASSPVSDFGFATALISLTTTIRSPQTLRRRLEISGRNCAPDNCSRTRDGFLAVDLRFLTTSGQEKMPTRRTSLSILLDITLACLPTEEFKVARPSAIPPTGQGRKFSVTVRAEGGMTPYRLRLFAAQNPLNIQIVSDPDPAPGVSQWTVMGVVPVDALPGIYEHGLCVQSDPDRTASAVLIPLSVPVLQQGPPWAYAEYLESPLKRAHLNLLYGKLLGSMAFYKWHDYVSGYGPLGFFHIAAYQRAAARMTLIFMQPALEALGKPLDSFIVSWYTTIENYARVGGLVDAMMSNLASWKPFVAQMRAKADQAWADAMNEDLGPWTRASAYATWFAIDELLHVLNVEGMGTHEEIEVYLAARNAALPRP